MSFDASYSIAQFTESSAAPFASYLHFIRDRMRSASRLAVAHADDAAEDVRVPTDALRHRLHGHVGPKRQWTRIERRSEGVQPPSAAGSKATPAKSSPPRRTS